MTPLNLKKMLVLLCLSSGISGAHAQSVSFSIDTQSLRKTISPLIYGYNAYADGTQRSGWDNQGGLANLQALNLMI